MGIKELHAQQKQVIKTSMESYNKFQPLIMRVRTSLQAFPVHECQT